MAIVNFSHLLPLLGTDAFTRAAKVAIENLTVDTLPLQQALTHSSTALDNDLQVTLLHQETTVTVHLIKAGIFYYGIVSGCSCADDPGPVEPQNEYCEILISISLDSGDATITIY